MEQREEERLKKKRNARDQGILAVNSNLYQGVLKNGSKCVVKEKEYLTYYESAIITMLRSEHIELNLYNCVIFGNGDANCEECDVYETVRHFLIDCTRYTQQRKVLRNKLIEVDKFFDDNKNFNAKRILFFHKYQANRNGENEINKRVKILKYVCSYVFETRRFKGEDIRSNIFKLYEMDQIYNIHQQYEFLSDRINNLNKKDIIEMAESKDESFRIKNEVYDKGEELHDDYIKTLIESKDEDDGYQDSETFFNEFEEEIRRQQRRFNDDSSSEDNDFSLGINIAESDSDYSLDSR